MAMDGSKAVDVVTQELHKLSMCKRGSLETERMARRRELEDGRNHKYPSEPRLNLKERKKVYTANRKQLLACLKYKPSDQLCHLTGHGYSTRGYSKTIDTGDIFTDKSVQKYHDLWLKLTEHKDWKAWRDERKVLAKKNALLEQEITQRMAILDADFDDAKMDFISEQKPLSDFRKVKDQLEAMTW